jgi:hypothetical protein
MKTKTDKRQQFLDWVNRTFRPESAKHPVAFKTADGRYVVTSECSAIYPKDEQDEVVSISLPVVDYYGEYRGGYAWIHPKIIRKAQEMRLHIEWENAACINIYEE